MCENRKIGATALFLAPPAGTYTTGSVKAVDGGDDVIPREIFTDSLLYAFYFNSISTSD